MPMERTDVGPVPHPVPGAMPFALLDPFSVEKSSKM